MKPARKLNVDNGLTFTEALADGRRAGAASQLRRGPVGTHNVPGSRLPPGESGVCMVKLYNEGVYLRRGKEVIPESEAAAAGIEAAPADARRGTIAYSILQAHNLSLIHIFAAADFPWPAATDRPGPAAGEGLCFLLRCWSGMRLLRAGFFTYPSRNQPPRPG